MLATLVLLLSASTCSAAYDRIYVFGDSYSDIGNGYVDGDGPTAVAYLAVRMGIHLLPANDSRAIATDSLNFAVSGAGTGRGEGRKAGDARLGIGMENQVEEFVRRVRDKRSQFDPERTLFFLAGGLNDRRLESAQTVRNLKSRIAELYEAGARHFALAILPEAIPAFHEVSARLNPEIAKVPDALTRQLVGIQINLSEWGRYFDEVMQHPVSYGIDNTKDACAGRAIFNEDATPCASPAGHYYYHAGHPSTAVHKVVGAKLFDEVNKQEKGRRD